MYKFGKNKIRTIGTVFCVLAISLLILWLLQRLVTPKYMHGIIEGAMIGEYYDSIKKHDVVFVGDCEIYENITPVLLWEKYGINSYIRGSAQQLIWQSYYLMEETLKYEKPQIMVFNVLSMQYDSPQSEAYNRMTLDGMKWSSSKVFSVSASMTPDEKFIEYVFPLLRYHSRITDLEKDDLNYFFKRNKVTFNGYYMRIDSKPVETIPEGRPLGNYMFGDDCYKYLDMMRELCDRNGVELILIKAPSLFPYWYDEWDKQIKEYADTYGISYYNFLDDIDTIGLDFQTDTYDGGLHLNLAGAMKLTDYFGGLLTNVHNVKSRRGDDELEKEWQDIVKSYNEEIERQETMLKTTGRVTAVDGCGDY